MSDPVNTTPPTVAQINEAHERYKNAVKHRNDLDAMTAAPDLVASAAPFLLCAVIKGKGHIGAPISQRVFEVALILATREAEQRLDECAAELRRLGVAP